MDELTFANTQIPVDVDNRLRKLAAARRETRSETIRQAIYKFLADNEPEQREQTQPTAKTAA